MAPQLTGYVTIFASDVSSQLTENLSTHGAKRNAEHIGGCIALTTRWLG
jgi:hypothetical protein